jgi:hypothetical protein
VAVEVVHGLAAVGFAVDDEAGAVFGAALFRGQFLGFEKEASQKTGVGGFRGHDIRYVPFGDDEEVYRRLGGYVVKGEEFVVFVQFF